MERRHEPPERARVERISGCAGIAYRIGARGKAEAVQVVTEYPLGIGFGEAARKTVEGSTWPESAAGPLLRFVVHNFIFN